MIARQFTRQRPPAGARLIAPSIKGGLWIPSADLSGSVIDASGCNPPGKIVGGVTLVNGIFGGPALKFNGTTGYVNCGLSGNTRLNYASSLPLVPRTVWAWVMRPSGSSQGAIFDKGDNNVSNNGFRFNVLTTGLSMTTQGSQNNRLVATVTMTAGLWYFVAATWDGSTNTTTPSHYAAIYVNGFPVVVSPNGGASAWASTNSAGNQSTLDNFNLSLGGNSAYVNANGAPAAFSDLVIDHWGMDLRAYSHWDIAQLYAQPFRGFRSTPLRFPAPAGGASAANRSRMFIAM